VAEVHGPEAALQSVDALAKGDDSLDRYYLFHAIRANLLNRVGRPAQPAGAYEAALACTANNAERDFLQRNLDAVAGRSPLTDA
jgi:RNA polymerase sigma-70 factor (ECF subfamily)